MITDESVERVRDGADIVQIISEHVKLKRVGNSFRGPCPFHQGTGPNFSVVPAKGMYHCFVCNESGDVFKYLQKRLGMSFPDAIRYAAQRSGIVIDEVQRRSDAADPRQPLWDVNAMAADWFRTQLWDERTGEEARNYLAFRRISRDVADRFGLGFAPRDTNAMREHLGALGVSEEMLGEAGLLVLREDSGELRPRFRNRLVFPILDVGGNCTGFGGRLLGPGEPKYLNSSESPVYSKGRILYGLHMAKHAIRREGRVMIVEGYFDVVRLVSAGFEWVVAPLGTALTEDQAALLPKYAKQAYLLYDNDKAGLKATFRSGDQLLRQQLAVQVVTLPEGEDPDSFVDKFGGEKLMEQLAGAVDIFERKLMELERGGYFADLHKKRVAIDKLLPTLRATADSITRDIYIARASEVSGVSRERLEREVAQLSPRITTSHSGRAPVPPPPDNSTVVERRTVERRAPTSPPPPKERLLVRILLHVRSLIEEAVETVGPDQLHDFALADIYRALLSGEPDDPADVLASRLVPDSADRFNELLNDPIGEGEKYAENFAALLAYFRGIAVKRELHEQQREMPIASLDQQDDILSNMERLRNEKNAMGDRSFKGYGPARKT
ncbi:MAG: DNA primase [Gemmatimonadaceae bacterium]|nr:DNA primase [Gemmatimonadaceae bacterium]